MMITTFGEVGRLQPRRRAKTVRSRILRYTGINFLVRNSTTSDTAFLPPGSYEMEYILEKMHVLAGDYGI
jgi:hypothetical protein